MPVNHLLVISSRYPSAREPNSGAFVAQLVAALAEHGVHCSVVRPVRLYERLRGSIPPGKSQVLIDGAAPIVVYAPRYLSFSDRQIGPLDSGRLTQFAFNQAVMQVVRQLPGQPDAVYGHFLYPGGYAAVHAARQLGKRAFVGVGESYLDKMTVARRARARQDFVDVAGFIANAAHLRQFLCHVLAIPDEKVLVLPNGVDLARFRPFDRADMRRKYGLPLDKFIVAFTGHFSERKGVLRVNQAIKDQPGIGAIFIGDGPQQPHGAHILFKGAVRHQQVAELLSAADIFALPTLAEGCSNAIIEAMACGLPIVTSDSEFNDEIVDSQVAIRVNPHDIGAIREAIYELKENVALRQNMATWALERAKAFDIKKRSYHILQLMKRQIDSRDSIDKYDLS